MKMRLFLLGILAVLLLSATGMTSGQTELDQLTPPERKIKRLMDEQNWKEIDLLYHSILRQSPESRSAGRIIKMLGVDDAAAALVILDQKRQEHNNYLDDEPEEKDFCLRTNPHNDEKEARVNIDSRRLNPPRYPREALLAGIEGTVWISVEVDDKGNPSSIVVGQSNGSDALDQAALDAAHKWLFCPTIQDGRPAPGQFQVSIDFSMTGSLGKL